MREKASWHMLRLARRTRSTAQAWITIVYARTLLEEVQHIALCHDNRLLANCTCLLQDASMQEYSNHSCRYQHLWHMSAEEVSGFFP